MKTIEASDWLKNNLKMSKWGFDTEDVMSDRPKYIFSFKDPVDASLFALRWV
jgi:hypothetical protein